MTETRRSNGNIRIENDSLGAVHVPANKLWGAQAQTQRSLEHFAIGDDEVVVEGMEPNFKQIRIFLEQSLMLVTALTPVIGCAKASQVANYALDHDLTLKEAALQLGAVSAVDFDRIVKS